MKLSFNVNEHIDFNTLVDSMQLDSGITVAKLIVDGYIITIETCGDVRVLYNEDPNGDARDGQSYRTPSDFPEGLMKYFSHEVNYAERPKNIYVDMNNWFELFVEKDGQFLWSDYVELCYCTPDELFETLWETYQRESRPKAEPGSVIHATLRNEDLIPAFLDKLRTLDNKRALRFKDSHTAMSSAIEDLENGETNPYWNTEEATEDCNDLADILGEYAPDGHYFGSHPGDVSDFGYWECE